MPDNSLRQIKRTLYSLKRKFGLKVIYRAPIRNDLNVRTGVVLRKFDEYIIRRAIVLPSNQTRNFIYDLAYIAANKNFTSGGFFDRNDRIIILDAEDFPKTFEPSLNDHVEFREKRYEITAISEAEESNGWLLKVRNIKTYDDE